MVLQVLKVSVSFKRVKIHQNTLKQSVVLSLCGGVKSDSLGGGEIKGVFWSYHSAYSPWLLYPESLDHLEHIHHSLCLTPLNGGGYGTEHTRPAHCITGEREGDRHTHNDMWWVYIER